MGNLMNREDQLLSRSLKNIASAIEIGIKLTQLLFTE